MVEYPTLTSMLAQIEFVLLAVNPRSSAGTHPIGPPSLALTNWLSCEGSIKDCWCASSKPDWARRCRGVGRWDEVLSRLAAVRVDEMLVMGVDVREVSLVVGSGPSKQSRLRIGLDLEYGVDAARTVFLGTQAGQWT